MNDTKRDVHEEMLERYTAALAAGDAPPAEVAAHVDACADCRSAAAELHHVWEALGRLGEVAPSEELRTGFDSMLRTWRAMEEANAERTRATVGAAREVDDEGASPARGGAVASHRRARAGEGAFRRGVTQRRLNQLGFALAALLGGVLIGVFAGADRHRDEVSDLRTEMRDMRQVLTLSLLQQSSASGRLQGVSMGADVARHDPQVLAALLDTLATDPNPNVRLAIVDALAPRAGDPALQQRLGQVLHHESEPLVQIALVDALLKADGEHARRIVAPLASDPAARPEVRKYIQQRLGSNV